MLNFSKSKAVKLNFKIAQFGNNIQLEFVAGNKLRFITEDSQLLATLIHSDYNLRKIRHEKWKTIAQFLRKFPRNFHRVGNF